MRYFDSPKYMSYFFISANSIFKKPNDLKLNLSKPNDLKNAFVRPISTKDKQTEWLADRIIYV